MKLAHVGALIIVALAASSAFAQTQGAQPPQMQAMPRAEAPVLQGETLHVARPAGLIRFDGVRGESQSRPGWIEAFSLTVTCGDAQTVQAGQEARTGDAAAGRQRPNTLTFTHRVDRASPTLFDAAATGKRLRTVEVDQLGTKWKIEDVQVTRVIEEARGTSRATETITLSFGKCTRQ
jgi:type VI secretion system secreted protein Hcp